MLIVKETKPIFYCVPIQNGKIVGEMKELVLFVKHQVEIYLKLFLNFLSLFDYIMVFLARSLAISDEDKKVKEEEDKKEEAMKKDLEEKLYFKDMAQF